MKALGFNTKPIVSLKPLQPRRLEIGLQGQMMRERDRGNDTGYMERLQQKQPHQNGSLQDDRKVSCSRGTALGNGGSVSGDSCLEIHQIEARVLDTSMARILRRRIASGNPNQPAGLKNGGVRSSDPIGRRDPNG